MSSFFSDEIFLPGTEVQISRFNPEELFPYTTYSRNKPLFHVPNIRKRYLLISSSQLVDMTVHSFKVSLATVTDVHNISDLLKVKFKNEEVVSLTFVGDKIQQYGMKETARCVDYIRKIMSENGIKANLLTSRYKKNIATAQGLLDTIREIESDFENEPSYDLVVTVMDVLRDAVELFGEANDSRYLRALDHIQHFLQRPDVVRILDEMSPGAERPDSASSPLDSDKERASTEKPMHISIRLAKQVGERRGVASGSPAGSHKAPQAKEGGPAQAAPSPGTAPDSAEIASRRKLSAGSSGESGAVARPRVASRIRRRSIRSQSLENAQFRTMDSLHFDDAEDALWVEDEELPGQGDIEKDYDIVDDENIALLDSMIGNMTHELEDIIGESVDLDEVPDWASNGRASTELGFTLSRGLSNVDVENDL